MFRDFACFTSDLATLSRKLLIPIVKTVVSSHVAKYNALSLTHKYSLTECGEEYTSLRHRGNIWLILCIPSFEQVRRFIAVNRRIDDKLDNFCNFWTWA